MDIGHYILYAIVISIYEIIILGFASSVSFVDHSKPQLKEYGKFLLLYVMLNMLGLKILEYVA